MEEIIRLQEYVPLWDKWSVDYLLYEGNLSNVYQVRSGDEVGVIKVVSVPQIDNNSTQNVDNREQMNNYFHEVVGVLENEISNLSVLEGIPNILTYKEYQAFERKEEIGYDFILRMDKEQNLLEYVAGKRIKNDEIVQIIKEIARTLQSAHEVGVIHKDIKVENIFVDENGQSLLGDFALARKIESFQSRSRKVDSVYTAPEVMSEYDYCVATDIFALGMVLYLLLNNGQIPNECNRRTFKTIVPKPERAKEKLAEITLKAISYRARDRYASAEDFFQALSELTAEDFEFPEDYAESEEAKRRIQEEKERRQREEEERLRREEEERRIEEEHRKREEEERRKAEEKLRREEAERRAEEERLKREEEERIAAEERLKREEEERKALEERLRREEEERKAAEERRAEEARIRKEEEERRLEKERQKREELERKAEEERQKREELERKAEEERQRREELEKKIEEERQRREEEEQKRQELIRIAEEERKRETEKQLEKEKENSEAIIANSEFCQNASLDGAAIQLDATISDMKEASRNSKKEMEVVTGKGERESVEDDRFKEASKTFTNYSTNEKYDDISVENKDVKLEKTIEESKTLLGQMEEAEKPEFQIHASAREYSGFFNFEETAAFVEKTTKKSYDKTIDEEPYEHQFVKESLERTVSKKPLVVIIILLLVVGAGTALYCNKSTRTMIQNSYQKALDYFEKKDVADISEDSFLAITRNEFTITEYQVIHKNGLVEDKGLAKKACYTYQN